MNQLEKMFVVKAAANKIGATKAHHLYCNIKGGYEYVHRTTDDFKNHQRDVNHFIDNDELVAMFWTDEVAKYNYKEFGDIVSFDSTFNSNKHIFCVFKNRDIKVIPKQYILRRWTRDIIPPDLRRKENRYGEKNVNIQRLTNEANFLVDDTLFLLSKDEEKMGTYVTNLKKLLDDVKTDMPNPPSRDTVIEDVFSVKQTNDVQVKNPTKAVNKGEHLKKGERLKSEREKAIKVAKKKARPCGFCKEVTNEHTKLTCPLNPNARKKRKATPVIDV
ncbi:FAR1-related sequence 5-like protein [Tanacetum coccineum]